MPANGTVVWATTTPVPYGYTERSNSDVISINGLYSELVDICNSHPGTDCYPDDCECPSMQNDGIHLSELGAEALGLSAAAAVAPYRAGEYWQPRRWRKYHSDDDRNNWWGKLASWQIG